MRRIEFDARDRNSCGWLLRELAGLADALHHIHNLSYAGGTFSGNSLVIHNRTTRKSGWHHDLKPENILFYRDRGSTYGKFCIADFGSGKVHTYRSGSVDTITANGTLTYEPPEAQSEGRTSRPHDVFSLGCVLLELLIWAVEDYQSVKAFSSNRIARRSPDNQFDFEEDDGFWQRTENGDFILRRAVMAWIRQLKQRQHYFHDVVDIIPLMLNPDKERRINAIDLRNTLDAIYTKSKVEFENFEDSSSRKPCQKLPQLSNNELGRYTSKLLIPVLDAPYISNSTNKEAATRQLCLQAPNPIALSYDNSQTVYQHDDLATNDVISPLRIHLQSDTDPVNNRVKSIHGLENSATLPLDLPMGASRRIVWSNQRSSLKDKTLDTASQVVGALESFRRAGDPTSMFEVSYITEWEVPGFLKAFFPSDVKLGDVMTLTGGETEASAFSCPYLS